MATEKKVTSNKKQVTKIVKDKAVVEVKKSPKSTGLSVPVYSLLGKETGEMTLPKSVFGAEVNKALLSQALRVYLNNQKGHYSNTKTRGEVEGSTRKIYAQKGTGRARHGGIRAPIFVGGGIALGPKSRNVVLDLPKKMKKASLISALSQKFLDKDIYGIGGFEKATGKTAEIAKFVLSIKGKVLKETQKNLNTLIIVDKILEPAARGARNIKGISFMSAGQLNAYEIIKAQSLLFTKEAVEVLELKVSKEGKVPRVSKGEEKEDRKISN